MPYLPIKDSTAKKLFALSKDECARPECNQKLIETNYVNIGEMCHIKGEKPDSARYDPEMTDEERRDIANLIVCCASCHKIIDEDVETYTVKKLQEMKKDHEEKEGKLLELTDEQIKKLMDSESQLVQQYNTVIDGQLIAPSRGDVTIQGWMPRDVTEFFKALMGGDFPQFAESHSKMLDNIEKFSQTFMKIGSNKIKDNQKQKFSDPDLRMSLEEAVKVAARKDSEEIHKILSHLIVRRVQHDDEIKKVVFNEAIGTVGRLTANQLKIIALTFVLTRVAWNTFTAWKDLENFFEQVISKLIPFRDTDSELGHIESVSCGHFSISSWDVITVIKNSFTNLFLTDFSEEEIQKLPVESRHIENVFKKTDSNSFQLKIHNMHLLEKYFENEIKVGQDVSKIRELLNSHFISNNEITTKIQNLPNGKTLLEQCSQSKKICSLQLNALGNAIALTYLETIAGIQLNPDIWIN